MKYPNLLSASVLLAFILGGCASQETVKPKAEETAKTTAAPAKAVVAEKQLSEQDRLRSQRNTYFAFDSSSISEEARTLIMAHAQYLAATPNTTVTLDGHADERGSREYNLRLGERRAQAVAKQMQAMGVAGNRITTNSYGEEKPVCVEHDEACWQKNRRVEIIYR